MIDLIEQECIAENVALSINQVTQLHSLPVRTSIHKQHHK